MGSSTRFEVLGAVGVVACLGWLTNHRVQSTYQDPVPLPHVPQEQDVASCSSELGRLRDGHAIRVNRATSSDLEALPGIGPSLAERIIQHRNAHGAFEDSNDLEKVRGIGAKARQRLQPWLQFEGAH